MPRELCRPPMPLPFGTLLCFAMIGLMAVTAGAAAFGAGPRPFTAEDLHAMQRLSDPQVSPDGSTVVFSVRTTDFKNDRGRTDLWTVPVAGGDPQQLTSHPAGDHSARWSVDGKSVLFLSSRGGSSQLWKIRIAGGEALQVTDLPLDVAGFVFSRDGTQLVVAMEVFPDCDSLQCTVDRLSARESGQITGRLYDRLFVRHWDTLKDGRRSHLFLVPDGGGEPVDLMSGMDADAPTKPFGGMEEVTFTPDGKGVVFTARLPEGEAWSTNFDLFLTSVDGSEQPVNLTEQNKAWDTSPTFSPDGRTLAWLAMERPGFEADRLRIVLRSWPDGEQRILKTRRWDRSVGGMSWAPDGESLYVTANDLGETALFSIRLKNGKVHRLIGDGRVRSPAIAGDRIIFGRDTFKSPVELFSAALDGGDQRPITAFNAERLSELYMGDFEQFTFKGWNNEKVYGYVIKPIGVMPARKFPVAMIIHGGPQGSMGSSFHYRWNPQSYASAGYGVIAIDFHGSTGYGQDFTDAISEHWGDRPLEDLQKGLAAALKKYDFLDGDRVAALGASYGGYMINWIAGNWPDRFRCLVNHDGVFDTRAMYFETEELWFPEWENGGTPWGNMEGFEKFNPVNYIENWKTPMLVVQGARDFRVPETQGLAAFTALQRKGVPSRFLYFPDENHWVLKPANSIFWHETVLEWLDSWTKAMP